jgi:hypothetical protein
MAVTRYVRHKVPVFVREDLKGNEGAFDLCHQCRNFKPDTKDQCPIRGEFDQTCQTYDLMAAMWECPVFDNEVVSEEVTRVV